MTSRNQNICLGFFTIVLYSLIVLVPTGKLVYTAKHGRDYASYHYALQVSVDGENPYNLSSLNTRAKSEKTRRTVHPFFYPPPALLSFVWAEPLSLHQGYGAFFVLNNLLWVGCLFLMRRFLKVSWLILALVCISFSPAANTMRMGQANILVLFFLLLGIFRRNGALLGVAAMMKMSPALIVFQWFSALRFRPVFSSVASAVVLSVLALALVGVDEQLFFYKEVLPSFSSGTYHGLQIPINLPANHSIADIWNQVWPGENDLTLSRKAKSVSTGIILTVLIFICSISYRLRKLNTGYYLSGAMVSLMIVAPVYTYEHHLVFAAFPVVLVLNALQRGELDRRFLWLVTPMFGFLAMPLFWLRAIQKELPFLKWALQESKFFAVVIFAALCIWLAHKERPRS